MFDTPQKIELVKGLLQRYAGVADPELRIEVVPWAMSHSTVGKGQAVKQCTACHASNSMLNRPLDLNTFLPQNVPVIYRGTADTASSIIEGKEPTFDNRPLLRLVLHRRQQPVGVGRVVWLAGGSRRPALLHRARQPSCMERTLMNSTPLYSLHERVWHWLQAAGMILLIVTGLAIHYPDRFGVLGSLAQRHTRALWLAAALILNAFLGAFYHLTAGKYHHFLPQNGRLHGRRRCARHASTCTAIFKGEKHPLELDPQRKLNSLQKITYLVLLNISVALSDCDRQY